MTEKPITPDNTAEHDRLRNLCANLLEQDSNGILAIIKVLAALALSVLSIFFPRRKGSE